MFGLRNNKEEALISLLIKNKGIGKDYSKIINEYLKSKLGEHINVPTEIKKSELDSNDTFYINKSNSIYKYLIHGDNNGIKQINRKDMNKLLYYMLTVDTYAKEIENSSFFFDYSIQEINEVLNNCIDTTSTTQKDYDNFKDLIEYFSPKTNFGACTLDFDEAIGLSIRKLENQYKGIVENDEVLSSNNESESNKANVKDFTTYMQEKYNKHLTELNDLKQKYEALSSTTNQSKLNETDIKDYIDSIEKKYDAILAELNYLRENDKHLSFHINSGTSEINLKRLILLGIKKYNTILTGLNHLKQKDQTFSLRTNQSELLKDNVEEKKNREDNIQQIYLESQDYPEVIYIDKFFKKNKYFLIRFFRRLLPIRNEKRYYKDVAINSNFGNKKVITQMMQYYIPATYNITGEEDDLTFKKLNQVNSDLDELNPIDKNENNLIEELWQKAIIEENAPNYFFVLAGTGRGKTSFIIKLYLKYLTYSHKFKTRHLLIATKFDMNFDSKIKIIAKKYKNYQERFPKTKFIILIDALDEDIMMNDSEQLKLRLQELSEMLSFFDSVIITSRKQLFPTNAEIENIKQYISSIIFYYINPFTEEEINLYIDKRYSNLNKEEEYKPKLAKYYVDKYKKFMSSQMLLSFMDYLISSNQKYEFNRKEELYHHLVSQWVNREEKIVGKSSSLIFESNYRKTLEKYSNSVAKKFYEEQIFGISKVSLNEFQKDIIKFEVQNRSMLYSTSKGYYFFAHKIFLDYFIANAMVDDIEFDEKFEPSKLYGEVEAIYYYLAWKKIISPIQINSPKSLRYKLNITDGNDIGKTIDNLKDYKEIKLIKFIKQTYSYKNVSSNVVRIFKNVMSIDWSNQGLKEVPALKKLNKLVILKLNSNTQIDISNISCYKSLVELEINNAKLSDIAPISSLENLRILHANNNLIEDISSLSNLHNLKEIFIENNRISDISPLSVIFGIQCILIKQNPIKTPLYYFRGCQFLQFLEISLTKNSDKVLDFVEQINHVKSISITVEENYFTPKHFGELKKIINNISYLSFSGITLKHNDLKLFLIEGVLALEAGKNVEYLDFMNLEKIHPVINQLITEKDVRLYLSKEVFTKEYEVSIERGLLKTNHRFPNNNLLHYSYDISQFYQESSYSWTSLFIKGCPTNLDEIFMSHFKSIREVSFNSYPVSYHNNDKVELSFNPNAFINSVKNGVLRKFSIKGWLLDTLDLKVLSFASQIFEEIEIQIGFNIKKIILNWEYLLIGRAIKKLRLVNINTPIPLEKLQGMQSTVESLEILNCSVSFEEIHSFLNLKELLLNNVTNISSVSDVYHYNRVYRNLTKLFINVYPSIFPIEYEELVNIKTLGIANVSLPKNTLNIVSPYLETLSINNVQLNNYDFLKDRDRLFDLNIQNQNIPNINILPSLNNLIELKITNSNLNQLVTISKFKKLRILNLASNKIDNIQEIRNLTEIRELYLRDNHIIDISSLSNLENLEYLTLSLNKIVDITPLKKLKKLKELHIHGNPIKSYKETIEELCKYNLTLLSVTDKHTQSIALPKFDVKWHFQYVQTKYVLIDFPDIPPSCVVKPIAVI